jgi:hypothetical protein
MTPQEVLTEIYKMPLPEQVEVAELLQQRLSDKLIDQRLQEALLKKGLLREIKPPRENKIRDFEPIKIKGKPLSETIIEERR